MMIAHISSYWLFDAYGDFTQSCDCLFPRILAHAPVCGFGGIFGKLQNCVRPVYRRMRLYPGGGGGIKILQSDFRNLTRSFFVRIYQFSRLISLNLYFYLEPFACRSNPTIRRRNAYTSAHSNMVPWLSSNCNRGKCHVSGYPCKCEHSFSKWVSSFPCKQSLPLAQREWNIALSGQLRAFGRKRIFLPFFHFLCQKTL